MTNEFNKQIEVLELNEETKRKVLDLIFQAGKEFPCLECPSKDACENFKWYIEWFGNQGSN